MTSEPQLAAISETLASLQESYAALSAELQLSREDVGWLRLGGEADQFEKNEINDIAGLSRIMAIKNPIIKRGVQVIKNYVFAQGVNVSVADPDINAVLQAFWDDARNQLVLTGDQALQQNEIERQTDGNLFFVLFTNPMTGRVRVRSIALEEITEVLSNPDDAAEVWYYKRVWQQKELDGTTSQRTALYPDWRYSPEAMPDVLMNMPVEWDAPIYHAKTGGYSNWKFGLSEIYSGIDWARAYKSFLEDWATITRALATFAFKAKVQGGSRQVAAVKSRIASTLNTTDTERNPPPVAGSTLVTSGQVDWEPVKTAGATTSMEDGRRLLLMVAASVGLPETFFGDSQSGSLATARSLDRPTELMMKAVQGWWATVLSDIAGYVILQAVKAPQGKLTAKGLIVIDDALESVQWNAEINATVQVSYPPIIEIDPVADTQAVMNAAPFLPDERLVAGKLLSILGFSDIDEILDRMFDGDNLDRQVRESLRQIKRMVSAGMELRS